MDFKDIDLCEPLRGLYLSGLTCLIRSEGSAGQSKDPAESSATSALQGEAFPEPWRSVLARVPGKVPCLWTYWELGLDLGSGHSLERRRLFSDIVQALGWPSGSLVFWPMSQADEEGLTLRDDCFWEGVRLVQPHSIVCFGEQAFQALFPDRPCHYGWFDLKECSCLFIPGPADMLPDNRQAKQIVWQALKELKPFTTG